jgi:hypothetical protein
MLSANSTERRRRDRKLIPLLMGLREIERPLLYFVGSLLENDHSSVIRLLQRPWFRRIWIVQEVAFAPKATVLCGKDSMDWDSFDKAVSLLERRAAPISSAFLTIISETCKAIQGGRYFGLHETIHRFQPFGSRMWTRQLLLRGYWSDRNRSLPSLRLLSIAPTEI